MTATALRGHSFRTSSLPTDGLVATRESASPGPVRVLFVHGTLEIGGAEEVRLSLLNCLDRRRYQARICCLQRGGPIADEASRLGYQVAVLGHRAHGLSLSALSALRQVIRGFQPHIVQTSLPRANYWGRLAAALERVPVIIAEEHTVADKSDWARPVIERILGPRTDCVIAVSHSVRRTLAARSSTKARHRTAVVRNPVNAARLLPRRPREEMRASLGVGRDEVVALHVGRMDRVTGAKGHDLLVRAAAALPASGPPVTFLLLGDGPARHQLAGLAERLGAADRVRFLGWQREVADHLAAADLFVFPSRCEGMPIALMEAMWMGLPVIASDIPANREVTRQGRYGRLMPALTAEALVREMAALMAERGACAALAERSQRYARHAFSPVRYARVMSQLWEHLLGEKMPEGLRSMDPPSCARNGGPEA
jgi:glycosyltransferase involved in cell wall biosynthesis